MIRRVWQHVTDLYTISLWIICNIRRRDTP